MGERVLRYRVELDTGGLQGQLNSISSSVTQGLNAGYSAAGQTLGTVGIAGDLMRRDLGMFFAPPPPGSGMYPGGSNQLMSQMAQMGTMPAQQSPFGLTTELSVLSGARSVGKTVGGFLRRRGFQSQLGLKPQNMTEAKFQSLAGKSFEERMNDLGDDLSFGAIDVGVGLAAFSNPLTAVAYVGAQAFGFSPGNIVRRVARPGEQLGRDISQVGRAYRAGGSRAFSAGEQRKFGKEVSDFVRGQDYFQGGQAQEMIAAGFASGAIKLRERGRGVGDLAKEVKQYLKEIEEATESMGTSVEETSKAMGETRQKFGTTTIEFKRFRQAAVTSAKETGKPAALVFSEQQQFASGLQQLGFAGFEAAAAAPALLRQAERDIESGRISRRSAALLGNNKGLTRIESEKQFLETGQGTALRMALSTLDEKTKGSVLGDLYRGTSIQEVISKYGNLSKQQYMDYLVSEESDLTSLASENISVVSASELVGSMGLPINVKNLAAGLKLRRPGLTTAQAEEKVAAFVGTLKKSEEDAATKQREIDKTNIAATKIEYKDFIRPGEIAIGTGMRPTDKPIEFRSTTYTDLEFSPNTNFGQDFVVKDLEDLTLSDYNYAKEKTSIKEMDKLLKRRGDTNVPEINKKLDKAKETLKDLKEKESSSKKDAEEPKKGSVFVTPLNNLVKAVDAQTISNNKLNDTIRTGLGMGLQTNGINSAAPGQDIQGPPAPGGN